MKGYLLDTNLLSEVRKGPNRANPAVYFWWQGMRREQMFLSVMNLGEVRKGIERLRHCDPSQTRMHEGWLVSLERRFAGRIFDITAPIAERWGYLQAIRPLPEIDTLLAATALEYDLTLVTRNEHDFAGLGITVLNPFEAT